MFHQPYKQEISTAEFNFPDFSIDCQGPTQLPRHKDLMPFEILQRCCSIHLIPIRGDTGVAPEGLPGHPKVSQKAVDIYGWATECPLMILAVWWPEENSWHTVWTGIIYCITLFYRLSTLHSYFLTVSDGRWLQNFACSFRYKYCSCCQP